MSHPAPDGIPKYELVKQYVLSWIQEKSLHVNDKLPGENELAERCGVSIITARKALADLVNEGYIYRIKGKGTFVALSPGDGERQRLRLIAFLIPVGESSDSAFMKMLRGAQACCSARGYSIVIEVSNDCLDLEHELIEGTLSSNMAGLILYSLDPEKALPQFVHLREKGLPCVLLDRYSDQLPMNVATSNNIDGAYQATEHLIRMGHRKILFAAHLYPIKTEQLRRRGYQLVLHAYGIVVKPELCVVNSDDHFPMICQMIRRGEVTAVVCVHDYLAIRLLDYLSRHGISVPGDVSLIGFDGTQAGEYVSPPLTSVYQDFYAMGEAAGRILTDLLAQPGGGVRQELLPVRLIVRASTAPPKSAP